VAAFSTARVLSLGLALALASAAPAHESHRPGRAAPAGPSAGFAFPVPEPGSYRLPPIRAAGDGSVLDEEGRSHRLRALMEGRITILAFIYTRCGDVCPMASLQLSLLQDRAARDPAVSRRLQLASMSFDPDYDTPAVLAAYAAHWRSTDRRAPPWRFLTSTDRAALAPVLAAYDQTIGWKRDPAAVGGPLHHVFRAYLVDTDGQVRNIYSLDFLDPDLVLADVRTLMAEKPLPQGTE
jgi:cytochrome oxidase Cu insertion factor (SCO1/SenC/PrrC family)